ncbi:MAG: hypothetical protein U5L04_17310 [Trueperaceae bacterium]|nr:hypothetical protein [Trueperaceae bacterium]
MLTLFMFACTPTGSSQDIDVPVTSLAFGPEGHLYLTSNETGAVYRVRNGETTASTQAWTRPFGIATLGEQICVSRYSDEAPLRRETLVSCYDGQNWQTAVRGVGQGINGLAAGPRGLWLAAWQDTPIESRDGLVVYVDVTNGASEIVRRVSLPANVPQFVAVAPDGTVFVSAWREDASGIRGGTLFRLATDGSVSELDTALTRPSGLAYAEGDGLWVADYATGELWLLAESSLDDASPTATQPFQTEKEVLGLAYDGSNLCAAHSRGFNCFDVAATNTQQQER